jgi:hypothetical protein
MTNDNSNNSSKPESKTPSDISQDESAQSTTTPPNTKKPDIASLSKEEQMALYEEALKDEDWGHQPC